MMAASLIVSLPIMIVFIVMQRYIVSGLVGGAVKG
jgi:multiple sugar transport system permease protein